MRKIITALLSIFVCSCTPTRVSVIDVFKDKVVNIELEPFYFNLDSLQAPANMLFVGDDIIFSEDNTSHALMIYNMSTNQFQHLLAYGKANNEILNVHQLGYVTPNKTFYVYDNYTNKNFIYEFSDSCYKVKSRREVDGYRTFSYLTEDLMMGCTPDSGRYAIIDTLNNVLHRFGDYSKYNLSVPIASGVLQGLSVANPNNHKYAWFSFYGEEYNIIEYKVQNSPKVISEQIYAPPVFKVNKHNDQEYAIFDIETPIGFTALTSNDRYICALYSGKKIKDAAKSKDDVLSSDLICIYSWDGTPVNLLRTNKRVKALSYNYNLDLLFVLSLDENDEYKLYTVYLNSLP